MVRDSHDKEANSFRSSNPEVVPSPTTQEHCQIEVLRRTKCQLSFVLADNTTSNLPFTPIKSLTLERFEIQSKVILTNIKLDSKEGTKM